MKIKQLISKTRLILWDLDETLYFENEAIKHTRQLYVDDYLSLFEDKKLAINQFNILESKSYRWFEIVAIKRGWSSYRAIQVIENRSQKDRFVKKNINLVELISKLNMDQVIVTNSPKKISFKVLKKLGFYPALDYFNMVYTIENFNQPKPNMSVLSKILSEHSSRPKESLMIGNSYQEDLLPASKLGMKTCLIGGTHSGADFYLDSLKELISAFGK